MPAMNAEELQEDPGETFEPAPRLPFRAASAKPSIAFALVFALVGLGWIWLASRVVDSGWGGGVLPDWLLRIAPALGVIVAGAVGFFVVVRRSLGQQRRLMREMNAAQEMLLTSQKLEALGVLAASMAHDFNNTLTVIRGMTDLAKLEEYEPRVSKSAMEAIQLATFRAEEIARQLIVFLSSPRDQFSLRDLNVVTREFSSIVRQAAGPHTTVEYDLEDGLPAIQLNRGMMEQALLNLVINARDAVAQSERPRITISTKTVDLRAHTSVVCPKPVSGAFVELSVSDNGCGIPEEDIARVFAPFFTTKRHGTGLGLPSVLRAVRQHDGFVDVRSGIGRGTSIKLMIPIRSEPRADKGGLAARQLHSTFA